MLHKKFKKEILSGVGNNSINLNNDFILTSFHPVTTETKNFRNGIFFKLYLNKRSANLNKQFIRPILYHC